MIRGLNNSLNYNNLYRNNNTLKQSNIDKDKLDNNIFENKEIENSKVKDNLEEDINYQSKVRELKQIEQNVIAHEQAHMSAGGGFVGPASYTYAIGPDGNQYIVGGEVTFNIPSGGSLEDQEAAFEALIKAALAPVDPSPTDIRVAASAGAKKNEISQMISQEKAKETYKNNKNYYDNFFEESIIDILV